MSLAMPLMLSALLEECMFVCISGFAAKLGSTQIATHNAMLNIFMVITSAMYGLSNAVTIRIGHHLGHGDAGAARLCAILMLMVAVSLGFVLGAVFVLARNEVGHIFSNDPAVWHWTSQLSILVGVCYVLLTLFFTGVATLQGQGRPLPIAVGFAVGAYAVAVPLGYYLAFPRGMDLLGLWLGLAAGYGVITVIVGWAALQTDWVEETSKAVERSRAMGEAKTDRLLPMEKAGVGGTPGGEGGGDARSPPGMAVPVMAGEEDAHNWGEASAYMLAGSLSRSYES